MRELIERARRGTETVFRSPKLATALYAGAVVAIMVTTGLRKDG